MKLYHGSNVEVRQPDLSYSRDSLDFGKGFYLTSDFGQAVKWAHHVARFRGAGKPAVSVFTIDSKVLQELSVLRFGSANREWLHTVVAYRSGKTVADSYDIITGPIANERTVNVINQYIDGVFPEEIALQLLLPFKLKDQWAIKTEKALAALVWKEAQTP